MNTTFKVVCAIFYTYEPTSQNIHVETKYDYVYIYMLRIFEPINHLKNSNKKYKGLG